MTIPADVLAARLSALSVQQRMQLRQYWREKVDRELGDDVAGMTRRWSEPELLPPYGDEPGWTVQEECAALVALDRLLYLCHPDVGHVELAEDGPLKTDVARAQRAVYETHGWWHKSERLLLLPRRLSHRGELLLPDPTTGPLVNSCVVVGEEAIARLDVVRVPVERDRDVVGTIGAHQCVSAPLVGAAALGLAFEHEHGRWWYRGELDEEAVTPELINAVLAEAEAAGASALVLPEYTCTPVVVGRWRDALAARPASSLRWVLTGTGPTEAGGDNVARLLLRGWDWVYEQPKTRPFEVRSGDLEGWCCPTMPADAAGAVIHERIRTDGIWRLVETGDGRIAIVVCESLRADGTELGPLQAACPTLILCPVMSKQDSRWERHSSERWGDRGTEVVIANSVVVAEWMADGRPLPAEVVSAAQRHLNPKGRRHSFKQLKVPTAGLVNGTLRELATIP